MKMGKRPRSVARRARAALAAAFATLLALVCIVPGAAYAKSADLGVSLGSGVAATKTFTLNQEGIKETTLGLIRECRQDALNDPRIMIYGMPLRTWLNELGVSEEEYLNPTWSNSLERVAIQRAAEGNLLFQHKRPNGDDIGTATYGNAQAGTEILASTGYIDVSMGMWTGEKDAYIESGCVWAMNTGHYMVLIDPSFTSFGFGSVGDCCAGEAMGDAVDLGSTDPTNLQGDYEISIGLPSSTVTADALTPSVTAVGVGKSTTVSAVLSYADTTFTLDVQLASKDPSIATVSGSTVTGVKAGTTTLTMTVGGVSKDFSFTVGATPMYRLYNPWTGEHFYTASAGERDSLVTVGWSSEGTGWVAPESGAPVYRLYNPYVPGGDHHYTMDENEYETLRGLGWRGEGIGWYSADASTGVPVYRQFNQYVQTGAHNYTTDPTERDYLVWIGWNDEGVAWYGVRS